MSSRVKNPPWEGEVERSLPQNYIIHEISPFRWYLATVEMTSLKDILFEYRKSPLTTFYYISQNKKTHWQLVPLGSKT